MRSQEATDYLNEQMRKEQEDLKVQQEQNKQDI